MKTLFIFLTGYFVFHAVRDIMQFLGIKNFITETGHSFGVLWTDKLLSFFGLRYQQKYELAFSLFSLVLATLIYKLGLARK